MNKRERDNIIKQLIHNGTKTQLYHQDIPAEYAEDMKIIEAERNAGIRTVEQRGFDVINQVFFVYESVLSYSKSGIHEYPRKTIKTFETFDDYYDYLKGDIYENACYYQCDFSNITKQIDKSRLYERNSFIEYDIDSYNIFPSPEEIQEYQEGEKTKKQVKKWVEKFVACDSYEQLKKTVTAYNKSTIKNEHAVDIKFFFWQYIFHNPKSKKRFQIIMQYMSEGEYPSIFMIQPLCHVYNPDEVRASYDFSSGSKQTRDKYNRKLREYIEAIKKQEQGSVENSEVYFNKKTHYYCVRSETGVCRYFETFEELIKYRDYDLRNTDLTSDYFLRYDFSKCRMDKTTKLPIDDPKDYHYAVKKEWSDGRFRVLQTWSDKNGSLVKDYAHSFSYFFDFVAFLKGDLSNADLLLCDGLKNLVDITGIGFKGAKITSSICDRLGINYKSLGSAIPKTDSFALICNNERESEDILQSSREEIDKAGYEIQSNQFDMSKERIYYVTDLHLMHKLEHFKPKTKADIEYVIQKIVNTIVDETGNNLLIGGDVSSDYYVFKMFIQTLRNELSRRHKKICVIFVLGNHELWGFQGSSVKRIVNKYNRLITENGMYLLQNDILFKSSNDQISRLTNKSIKKMTTKKLRGVLMNTRAVFFGGLAFSGYNKQFNADNGIYRDTINRDEEIEESKDFEELYDKVLEAVPDKRIVILTHTPMDCWHREPVFHSDYVYVSGHTHNNQFYDDGETRIYADNQIGYSNNNPHLKWFDVDNEYDTFADYIDGIYQITADNYKEFYKGKNLSITFNREVHVLYMLKKKGYYCFILKSKGESLSILNGGALKKLEINDVNYYYDNMDSVIATIKSPLDKYTDIQNKIAEEIRKIGGFGRIHGCIIDIDFFNHVYVNPLDMKITAYWAADIINKKVYPGVSALLEAECPKIYLQYKTIIKNSKEHLPILKEKRKNEINNPSSFRYLDTDIYKASREIKKMQKLQSNILTVWYELNDSQSSLEANNSTAKRISGPVNR